MAANEIHVDDIGTVFQLTIFNGKVVSDLSNASLVEIYLQQPSGTILTRNGIVDVDGTTGIVRYTTVAGDLSVAGGWKIQGKLTFADGEWYTDISTFTVYPNLV